MWGRVVVSHRHGSVIFMGKICWGIFGGKNMLGGDDPSKFFFCAN